MSERPSGVCINVVWALPIVSALLHLFMCAVCCFEYQLHPQRMVQNERARARLCIPTHVVLFASASFSHTVILRSHASSTYSYTRSVECDMYAETMIPNAAEHTIVLRSNGNAYQYDEFVCGNATQRTLAHQRYRCWFGFTSALL